MATSLDVTERQILIVFSPDRIPWHHWLLLERSSQARWGVATPTPDAEVADLDAAEDFRPGGRAHDLPVSRRPVYAFDELSASELNDLRGQATRLADIFGVCVDGEAGGFCLATYIMRHFAVRSPP